MKITFADFDIIMNDHDFVAMKEREGRILDFFVVHNGIKFRVTACLADEIKNRLISPHHGRNFFLVPGIVILKSMNLSDISAALFEIFNESGFINTFPVEE